MGEKFPQANYRDIAKVVKKIGFSFYRQAIREAMKSGGARTTDAIQPFPATAQNQSNAKPSKESWKIFKLLSKNSSNCAKERSKSFLKK